MKKEQEILDHLSKTVYTHSARKNIIGYLRAIGIEVDGAVFAAGSCQGAATFDDFVDFVEEKTVTVDINEVIADFIEGCSIHVSGPKRAIVPENADDFQIGDWVKYCPNPSECYTGTIEAIAISTEGGQFLCLSNGEYVRPCFCMKYKLQGEERRKLIDKLNEVI